ncbi:MAG: DUF3168 domain-containing protein [Beijerinckiaceae bacterium]
MSFSSEIALRAAIRNALLADAPLTAQLGGPFVHDEAPRDAPAPYIVFARSEARDWSTMTERGAEHLITMEVWSQSKGVREALSIAGRVADLLHEAPLAIAGASCVRMQIQSIETLRQNANRFVRARIRLRALVENEE